MSEPQEQTKQPQDLGQNLAGHLCVSKAETNSSLEYSAVSDMRSDTCQEDIDIPLRINISISVEGEPLLEKWTAIVDTPIPSANFPWR